MRQVAALFKCSGPYPAYFFLKVNLKYNSNHDKLNTTILAEITGPLWIPKPYNSQIAELLITINIIHTLTSPTLFVRHDLYTWGTKVKEVRNDPI